MAMDPLQRIPKEETFPCPLCKTELPLGALECTNCDWVKGYRHQKAAPLGTSRDLMAVFLSIVPGLGHYFKGHPFMGLIYFFMTFVALFVIGVVGLVGMGFNLLLIPFYWAWVMLHAYLLPDLHAVDHIPRRIS